MILLKWIAKEIKKRIPRYEPLRPMTKGWRSKTIGHKEEGAHQCWFEATNLHSEKPYFVLTFGNRNSDKRVRINILPWEEKERTPRKLLKSMRKMMVEKREKKESPFIFNPLYVSDQLPVKDIETLIALRLLQEGEPAFYGLIEEWVKNTFPKGWRRIEDPSILIEYLRDHFNLQEDWKGWRSYVAKAIKKFYSESQLREKSIGDKIEKVSGDYSKEIGEDEDEKVRDKEIKGKDYGYFGTWKDEQTGEYFYTVKRTSELTGISEVTLYRWIKNGKIMTKTERGFMFLDIEEVEKIRDQKHKRKGLVNLIAKRKRIEPESARRWIKRMENQGLNQKEILKKGKELLEEG